MDPRAPLGVPQPPRPGPSTGPPGARLPPTGPSPPGAYPGAGPPPTTSPPPAYGAAPGPPPRSAGYQPPPQLPRPEPPAPRQPRPRGRSRRDPGGLVAGLVIAGIGLFFLAGQLEPNIGRFVPLFIGLALLAVFVVSRQYGFLIPGSLLTGVGIGMVLDSAAAGDAQNGVMMLALAGGFLGIWVLGSIYRVPQNHWWPLIPGGILTLIGLVQLSRTEVAGALSLWPVILIIIGALVLARTITRRD